jgi:hypothetical protein
MHYFLSRQYLLIYLIAAGVDYEYKAVNLLKGEQSDPGALVLLLVIPTL